MQNVNKALIKKERNKGLGIMKLFPKDLITHAEKTKAGIKKNTKTGCAVCDTVTHISDLTGDAFLHVMTTQALDQETCLLGYQGISADFPTLYHPEPPPLAFCAVPLEPKGAK